MIDIAVIDETAEGRNEIIEQIHNHLINEPELTYLISEIKLKSYSPAQNIYQPLPQIIFVGNETSTRNHNIIKKIRALAKQTTIIAVIEERSLTKIEQLSRLEIDDIIIGKISASDIVKRFYFPLQKYESAKKGKIILVDSGKGGVGATTITAGLAEHLYNTGNKTLLVDLDWETQDLTRFLKIKPAINENLDLLINKSRPLFKEYLAECYQFITEDERFACFPPSYILSRFNNDQNIKEEILIQILKRLVDDFDFIVIDSGAAQRDFLTGIYEVAEKIIFVVDSNPASFHASIEKLKNVVHTKTITESIGILENQAVPIGLASKILRLEFNKLLNSENVFWIPENISYSIKGSLWPGSGGTILSTVGNKKIKKIFAGIEKALFPSPLKIETHPNESAIEDLRLKIPVKHINLFSLPKKLIEFVSQTSELIRISNNQLTRNQLISNQQKTALASGNEKLKFSLPVITRARISS